MVQALQPNIMLCTRHAHLTRTPDARDTCTGHVHRTRAPDACTGVRTCAPDARRVHTPDAHTDQTRTPDTRTHTSHSVHTCLPVYTQAPTGSTSVGLTLYCQYTWGASKGHLLLLPVPVQLSISYWTPVCQCILLLCVLCGTKMGSSVEKEK